MQNIISYTSGDAATVPGGYEIVAPVADTPAHTGGCKCGGKCSPCKSRVRWAVAIAVAVAVAVGSFFYFRNK